jgi:signal transduction histidine kinase
VSAAPRAHRVPLGAEVALAFVAGAGAFVLVAVVVAGIQSDFLIVLLGGPFVAAIVVLARRGGVEYAVPIAMAGMIAYDWYRLSPVHPFDVPDPGDLADLLVYLAVAVLIGELAAHAARHAEVSEAARSLLAEEQAALRRVATRVAQGMPAQDLLKAVAEEAGTLLNVDATRITRYEGEDVIVNLTQWSRPGYDPPPFERANLEGQSVSADVLRTGRVARIDNYDDIEHRLPVTRGTKVKSGVGAPILVEGRLWGVMVAWSSTELLPPDSEARLMDFTELVATAIANTEARRQVEQLVQEQVALRRVATLVAGGVPPPEVFETVTREVGLLSGADLARMERYESDGTVTGVGVWSNDPGNPLALGTRISLEGVSIAALVQESERPMRVDSFAGADGPIAREAQELGIRSSVGCPIVVEGHLWGVIAASTKSESAFPVNIESRIGEFTELVATAISNAEAAAEVARLADGQAALRRVATQVAQERPAAEVFAAVSEEVGRLLHVDATAMLRYQPDGTATIVAEWSDLEIRFPVGTAVSVEGNIDARAFSSEQPAPIDQLSSGTGALADVAREMGIRSSAGSPIVVQGRVWGLMIAVSMQAERLPPETELRMGEFTELVATAISNIEARSDLAASRARIVTATDQARRRFERDLHDGVQQRLVSLTLELRGADATALPESVDLRAQLSHVSDGLTGVLDDLRELARGIHPAILSEGGLGPALRALARRSAVPTTLDINVTGRLAERVEVAAYYVVSEALTNAAKHAGASLAEIQVEARDGVLDLRIRDDGVGGADPAQGSGLIGLTDRVEALGGRIAIASPGGKGTSLHVELPVEVA